jgi:F-type H+-transporting ATPase subunit epsilon
MATFTFELVSPERLLFSGQVQQVVVPGTEGDFAVLKDHAPVMSTLRPGVAVITDDAGKTQRLFVRGGFAEVKAAEKEFEEAQTEEGRRLAAEKLAHVLQLRDACLSRTHVAH